MASATITAIRKALGQQAVGIFGPPGAEQLQPVGVSTMGPDGNTAYSQNYAAAIREPDNALQTDALRVLAAREGQANQRAQEAALRSASEIARITADGEVLKAGAPAMITNRLPGTSSVISRIFGNDPLIEATDRLQVVEGKNADRRKTVAETNKSLFDTGIVQSPESIALQNRSATDVAPTIAPPRPFGNYSGQQAVDLEEAQIAANATTTAAALRGKEGGDGLKVTVTGDGSGPPQIAYTGPPSAFPNGPAAAVPMRDGLPERTAQPGTPTATGGGGLAPEQRARLVLERSNKGAPGMYSVEVVGGRVIRTNNKTGETRVF